MTLTNYKCNEQRTLDTKADAWKEGKHIFIRKDEGVVKLTLKEAKIIHDKLFEIFVSSKW